MFQTIHTIHEDQSHHLHLRSTQTFQVTHTSSIMQEQQIHVTTYSTQILKLTFASLKLKEYAEQMFVLGFLCQTNNIVYDFCDTYSHQHIICQKTSGFLTL